MRKSTLLIIMSVVLSLFSCEKYKEGGTPHETKDILIRFVSEAGTNILDSLFEEGVITGNVDDVFTVTWRRQFYGDEVYPEVLLLPTGDDHTDSYLNLRWLDSNITNGPKDGDNLIDSRPWSYTDVYIIDIVSPLVFGDDAARTILWQQEVEGRLVRSTSLDIGGAASMDDVTNIKKGTSTLWLQFIVRKSPPSE